MNDLKDDWTTYKARTVTNAATLRRSDADPAGVCIQAQSCGPEGWSFMVVWAHEPGRAYLYRHGLRAGQGRRAQLYIPEPAQWADSFEMPKEAVDDLAVHFPMFRQGVH